MNTIRQLTAGSVTPGVVYTTGTRRRRGLKRLAALTCVVLTATLAVFLGQVPAAAEEMTPEVAPAAPTLWSEFNPGTIISDAQFYDTASMTQQQIHDFIRTEGAACTGSWCLKNLHVSTQDQPADRYCAAYVGGVNEEVSAILVKVSVACGINPQVMLVTLQKESALLSRTEVTESAYDAAWGWHCPDSGPGGTANCDPEHAGFFNQAYGMAKQWSRYRVDPEKYNYRAGQTVNILWNVQESGCGSSPVAITNTATASLYNYTPYQPNAASLAAYPASGDACSSYGNRNFFYLFHRYFGSAGGDSPTSAPTESALVTIPNQVDVPAALAGHTITAPNAAVAAGLAAGFAALGMPYVWGGGGSGAGPNNGCSRGGGALNSCGTEIGFDCSGLTAFVLGTAGYLIPDNSGSQRSQGVKVSWAQALPGDVVGFPGHVAIYLGSFGGTPYILEASTVGTQIHVTALTRTDVDGQLYRYWTGPAVAPRSVADFSWIVQQHPAEERWRPAASVPEDPQTLAGWEPQWDSAGESGTDQPASDQREMSQSATAETPPTTPGESPTTARPARPADPVPTPNTGSVPATEAPHLTTTSPAPAVSTSAQPMPPSSESAPPPTTAPPTTSTAPTTPTALPTTSTPAPTTPTAPPTTSTPAPTTPTAPPTTSTPAPTTPIAPPTAPNDIPLTSAVVQRTEAPTSSSPAEPAPAAEPADPAGIGDAPATDDSPPDSPQPPPPVSVIPPIIESTAPLPEGEHARSAG